MLQEIMMLVFLTFLPFLELRAAIPYGILVLKMNWLVVFIICVIANIILGPLVYLFLDNVIHLFLRVKWIDKLYAAYVEKTQRKVHKYVEKYGLLGVAAFIGIPLPGSGSYTGATGSYLLGIDFKKFTLANVLGVLIAGTLVTIIVLSGNSAFGFFVKMI